MHRGVGRRHVWLLLRDDRRRLCVLWRVGLSLRRMEGHGLRIVLGPPLPGLVLVWRHARRRLWRVRMVLLYSWGPARAHSIALKRDVHNIWGYAQLLEVRKWFQASRNPACHLTYRLCRVVPVGHSIGHLLIGRSSIGAWTLWWIWRRLRLLGGMWRRLRLSGGLWRGAISHFQQGSD